jgi:Phosphotransferase enzyme family
VRVGLSIVDVRDVQTVLRRPNQFCGKLFGRRARSHRSAHCYTTTFFAGSPNCTNSMCTAIGLGSLAAREAGEKPAARQLAYVERYVGFASPAGHVDPTLAAALQWLRQHCPLDDEPEVLCWGDARLANSLIADDLSVAAMLDWEEADVAPPGVDLGYWIFSMRHYSEGLGLPLLPGFPSTDETVARYEQLTGRPVLHREFYEVLAATRSCCIVVRLMNLMVEGGMLPPHAELISNNPSTQLLAQTLGLPAPGGRPQDWAGLR